MGMFVTALMVKIFHCLAGHLAQAVPCDEGVRFSLASSVPMRIMNRRIRVILRLGKGTLDSLLNLCKMADPQRELTGTSVLAKDTPELNCFLFRALSGEGI